MRQVHGLLLAALMIALVPFTAFAQAPTPTPAPQKDTVNQSTFQIQNIGEGEANVRVRFISSGTGSQAGETSLSIPAGENRTIASFLPDSPIPSGFVGSVIIEADQPVLAIANLTRSPDFRIAEGYPGFRDGAPVVNIPLVLRNNPASPGQFTSTTISVQNVSTTQVSVVIEYKAGGAGNDFTAPAFTLAAGQSRTFNQFDVTELGELFVGAATIRATGGNIVAAVTQQGDNRLKSYAGFTSGDAATSISAPLVVANNTDRLTFTSINVQNAGQGNADITLSFSQNVAKNPDPQVPAISRVCEAQPQARTFRNIQPGQSINLLTQAFAQDAQLGPTGGFDAQFFRCLYVGSVTVTSNQPLVGIVNQEQTRSSTAASAYEAFPPIAATQINAPLIAANNAGFFTSLNLQNQSESGSATVQITYSKNTYTQAGPNDLPACGTNGQMTPRTVTLEARTSLPVLQLGVGTDPATLPTFDPQFNRCTYVGSASLRVTGGNVVAVVNQENIGFLLRFDGLTTYNGFNQ